MRNLLTTFTNLAYYHNRLDSIPPLIQFATAQTKLAESLAQVGSLTEALQKMDREKGSVQ